MASSKDYLEFILEQLSYIDGITYRYMMSEYILYINGRIFGGIYDNRFMVKITSSSKKIMPDADEELPYEGAKPMLLVTEVDNRDFLKLLIESMYPELPEPVKKKKR
ncbi:MAG: TfoX/Sxy family protein [Clostridia bacterium]|nr:TfoX/Sxy family protein [Clostridia bacterium]